MKTHGYEIQLWSDGLLKESAMLTLVSWGSDSNLYNGQLFHARAIIFSSRNPNGQVLDLPDSNGERLFEQMEKHFSYGLTTDDRSAIQIACHSAVGAIHDPGIRPPAAVTVLWGDE
jgi:hypothetical protein